MTKSLMPNKERFHTYVNQTLDSSWLNNRGQHVCELEFRLESYFGVRNVELVNNASLAGHILKRGLNWEREVFFAVDAVSFDNSPTEIEKKITLTILRICWCAYLVTLMM